MGRPAVLKVDIVGDSRRLTSSTRSAESSLSRLGRTSSRVGRVLGAATVGGVAAVGAAMVSGIKSAAEFERLQKQTGAVLKSTGRAAGVNAKHVRDLANTIEGYSTIGDDAIQAGENLLLTFTNLRNEAGKGNDIFDQTTKIMADMSTALGQDTSSSAIQLGKALNDPIKGVTALQRVGVSFTAGQREQIKAMVDAGNTMGAQKLILAELHKEFGGSAKAAGSTFAGALTHLKDVGEDFLRDTMLKLLPSLTRFANFLRERAFPAVGRFASALQDRLGPVLRSVRDFIRDRVIPAAQDFYHWFAEKIAPKIRDSVVPVLADARDLFRSVGKRVDNNRDSLRKLVDGLRELAEFIAERVLPALSNLNKFGLRGMSLILQGQVEILATEVDLLDQFIEKLKWLNDHGGNVFGKLFDVSGLGVLSKLGGVPLTGGVTGLTGRAGYSAPAVGEMAQASMGDPGVVAAGLTSVFGRPVVVDSRTFPVTVNVHGALDPVSVARQLETVLRDHAVRQRRQPAWGS